MTSVDDQHQLGGTGVWSPALRYGDPAVAAEAAARIELAGYSALWVPDVGGDLFSALDNLLGATSDVTVATGILNLWLHEPEQVAQRYSSFVERDGPRLLLGIGVSHAALVDMAEAGRYRRPLARMREYLDALDSISPTVPPGHRVLAALGPKMLELAAARSAGSHPYLVTPEHTAAVRSALGPDRIVAPEQAVVLETDPAAARELARRHLAGYLSLPNYANNWARVGLGEEDTAGGGSDRLVDALVAWGDEQAIAERVRQHRDAGADHVCIQALTTDLGDPCVDVLERLAPALT